METLVVPGIGFKVIYAGKNITQEVSQDLIKWEYKDSVKGESDELTITMQDKNGLWKGPYFPVKGDKISLEIGIDKVMNCGTFAVDEVEVSGPPDIVMIKALAAGTNTPIRSKNSRAYEGQTLRQIAKTIADKYGYTIVDGEVERIDRKIDFSIEKKSLLDVSAKAAVSISFNNLVTAATKSKSIAQSIRKKGREGLAKELEAAARSTFNKNGDHAGGSLAFDDKKLDAAKRSFIKSIADVYQHLVNYTSSGTRQTSVLAGIKIARVTQNRESDLAFLTRLCEHYGIAFSIRDTKMIFTAITDLENGGSVLTIDRTELIRYSLKDKSTKIYKKARIRHFNTKTGKVVKKEVDANDIGVKNDYDVAPDTLEIHVRAENIQQAETIARAQLHSANTKNQEGSFSIPGNILMVSGANFILTGMGGLNGKYHIKSSTHSGNSAGYITDIEAKRLDSTSGVSSNKIIGSSKQNSTSNTPSFKQDKADLVELINKGAAAFTFSFLLDATVKTRQVATRINKKGRYSQAKTLIAVCDRVKAKSQTHKGGIALGDQDALKAAKEDFTRTLTSVNKNL